MRRVPEPHILKPNSVSEPSRNHTMRDTGLLRP